MALFLGEHDVSIDSKHRLPIPAALREEVDPEVDGASWVLLLGPDRHLWLFPDKSYREMLGQLRRSPFPDRQSRKLDLVFAAARIVKPDKQGRVVLPEKSMRRAEIADDVTLVGQYDHIAVWPRADWEKHMEEGLPGYSETVYEIGDRLAAEAARREGLDTQ